MKKKRIEFLKDNIPGWTEGYITTIESEDSIKYYFMDDRGNWYFIPKNKENKDYRIYLPGDKTGIWGGKGTTYNALKKKADELKKQRDEKNLEIPSKNR